MKKIIYLISITVFFLCLIKFCLDQKKDSDLTLPNELSNIKCNPPIKNMSSKKSYATHSYGKYSIFDLCIPPDSKRNKRFCSVTPAGKHEVTCDGRGTFIQFYTRNSTNIITSGKKTSRNEDVASEARILTSLSPVDELLEFNTNNESDYIPDKNLPKKIKIKENFICETTSQIYKDTKTKKCLGILRIENINIYLTVSIYNEYKSDEINEERKNKEIIFWINFLDKLIASNE